MLQKNGTKKWLRRSILACGVLGAWLVAAELSAAEETQRFLDALRSAGYHDMALEYLEQMRTSPLADEEFKQTIDLEAGITLIQAAQQGRSIATREKQLGQAEQMLQRFLNEHAQTSPGRNRAHPVGQRADGARAHQAGAGRFGHQARQRKAGAQGAGPRVVQAGRTDLPGALRGPEGAIPQVSQVHRSEKGCGAGRGEEPGETASAGHPPGAGPCAV